MALKGPKAKKPKKPKKVKKAKNAAPRLTALEKRKLATNNAALIDDPEFAPFDGHFRRLVKTSIARDASGPVPVQKYATLGALIQTLTNDAQMRTKYRFYARSGAQKAAQQSGDTGPQARFSEEMRNVQVAAWICAVKYEWGKTGDNDFHVILCDSASAGANATYMTAEVSALPVVAAKSAANPNPVVDTASPDYAALLNVRKQLIDLFPGVRIGDRFYEPPKPVKVVVSGSLHFDGDHQPAPAAGAPGPAGMQPDTVWEIHPVSNLAPG